MNISLNAGSMATGNLLKTLVSKEKRRYKEGGYDLDLTCIPPSSIVLVLLFVCCAIVGNLLRSVNGGPLGCMDPFQTIRYLKLYLMISRSQWQSRWCGAGILKFYHWYWYVWLWLCCEHCRVCTCTVLCNPALKYIHQMYEVNWSPNIRKEQLCTDLTEIILVFSS